jgi:hypothetical protein
MGMGVGEGGWPRESGFCWVASPESWSENGADSHSRGHQRGAKMQLVEARGTSQGIRLRPEKI